MTGKRNSIGGIAELDPELHGVGGRQGDPARRAQGGGYQDFCTSHNSVVAAPALEDLRQCRLPQHWRAVAGRIGVGAFLEVWEELSEHPEVQDNHGRVQVPSIRTYHRLLRNRWIRTLATAGLTPPQIQQEMRQRLGHTLALRTIREIISEG